MDELAAAETFELLVPLDSPGGRELDVQMLNRTKVFVYNPPYGQMDKRIAEAGARNQQAELLRLRGRTTA